MPHSSSDGFNVLPLNSGGALILSAHPASLPHCTPQEAVALYAQLGARALVSLVTHDELVQLQLLNLPALCAAQGMHWLHGPIQDYQAPDATFDQWWIDHRQAVQAILDQQHTVAIHCWGGKGRTGTLAARILSERGMPAQEAIDWVRAYRPGAIETAEQTQYVLAHASHMRP